MAALDLAHKFALPRLPGSHNHSGLSPHVRLPADFWYPTTPSCDVV
jgi:hypothetical protein